MESLRELFVKELSDAHDAERQILKALPRMAEAAETPELRNAFEEHRRQTEGHVQRLQVIFGQLGESPMRKKCKGMKGLLAEGEEMLKESGDAVTIDAGMIAEAQKVEHYEIALYGTLRAYAQALGESSAFDLLTKTLEEEKQTDARLTQLAQSATNPLAARRA